MPVLNRKLPDDDRLVRDAAAGMTAAQIALRYKATQDYVSRRLKQLDLTTCLPAKRRHEPCDIPTITVERRVTAAEFGGTTIMKISLPRISMHAAAIAEASRHG